MLRCSSRDMPHANNHLLSALVRVSVNRDILVVRNSFTHYGMPKSNLMCCDHLQIFFLATDVTLCSFVSSGYQIRAHPKLFHLKNVSGYSHVMSRALNCVQVAFALVNDNPACNSVSLGFTAWSKNRGLQAAANSR